MSAKVSIVFEGLDTVLQNLTQIEEKAPQNLEKLTRELARDTEQAWRQATPRDTGRMQSEERSEASGLSFTLQNNTHYYKFVDEGHMTPAGWRTKRGYRRAKRRSRVAARNMTKQAIEFVEQNIRGYLVKFLDNV
jgi:16S rRNA C1402 (ribose-2'-O) methylase RsmI